MRFENNKLVRFVGANLLLMCLLSCDSGEKDARKTLNQAILAWDAGDVVTGNYLFESVNHDYPSTSSAAEAEKERTTRIEIYQAERSDSANAVRNYSELGKETIRAIGSYKSSNEKLPDSISQLKLSGNYSRHAKYCDYRLGFLGESYWLDCTKARSSFLSASIDRARRGTERKRQAEEPKALAIKKLKDFDRAKKTWGMDLNPLKTIPSQGYYAAYINTNSPTTVIDSEIVEATRINYSWSDFHGIDSQDFGAYWVGKLKLDAPAVRKISIDQGHSKTRLIIDGYVVYEVGGNRSMLLSLDAGEHVIEVEYVNNWHTTSFALEISEETRIFGQTHIKEQLAGKLPKNHDVYHGTVYESSSKDLSLMVKIEKSPRPVVLRLSSYHAVAWQIYNPHNTEILAIVYGAFSPGSTLTGDIADSVLRYPAYKRLQGANYKRSSNQCTCSADGNRCDAYKGRYSAEALDFPACG